MAERCVRCGEIIPEGRQVCPSCEKGERKMANLKPCPFCGGEARRYEGRTDFYGVTCKKCSCKVFGYASAGSATRAWNRRAEE